MKLPIERFLHRLNHAPRVRPAAPLAPAASMRISDNASARIAGRFARCPVQRPLDRVLAIPRLGSWTQYLEGSSAFTFAPRVSLSLAAPAQPLAAHTIERESGFVARVARTLQIDRLVERLTTRVERIDTLRGERVVHERVVAPAHTPETRPASSSARAPAALPHSVERILRAPAVSAPASMHGETRASAAPREGERPRLPAPVFAPESRPRIQPFDVEQLADRVVRVIDRRLTASRERLGRI